MTENKRFSVKQRQGATIYSIIDYYGELPLSEGIYYKSNANKLCDWLNTQHELLNTLYNENEQLKQEITHWKKILDDHQQIVAKTLREQYHWLKNEDKISNQDKTVALLEVEAISEILGIDLI